MWLYQRLAAYPRLGYRGKILLIAFIGIHVPLIALAVWYAVQGHRDWATLIETLVVTLVATLLGTGATLFVLGHLLRPVTMTSQALRAFREQRERIALPIGYADEVGTLMEDAQQTLLRIDGMLDTLEFVDEASGLPNRKRFVQQLALRIAGGQPLALAVLQFKNLPRIVETLDLRHADEATRVIAARLADRLEFSDQLARIGSASFACIVGTDTRTAQASIQAGLQHCTEDFPMGDMVLRPVLHAGLASYPADAADAHALIDAATTAAIQASPLATVALHSAQARQAALSHFRLEQDLRQALEREQFSLHFQPVVDLQAGRTIGAEALLRWNHPERGTVPPLAFIGTAESSGLIEPIGLWVLHKACEQLRDWNQGGMPGLRMAVNVSARQFLNPALKQHVIEAIERCGIAPDQLEIELTETAAMADHAHTRRMFTALRDAGIRIAIDDFGTGYASMSHLRKLPFDKLKIDREFIADVSHLRPSQAICAALIELCKGLNLQVLAEGAETEAEVHYLASRGCTLFQGYYFSHPVAAEAFGSAMALPIPRPLLAMAAAGPPVQSRVQTLL